MAVAILAGLPQRHIRSPRHQSGTQHMTTYLLGIDIGTSSAKALLYDATSGAARATASHEYPLHRPAPDRAEQDPLDWWQATVTIVRRLVQQTGIRDIAAIGLTGQMHGTLLLDHAGQPLHPAIIWADQRSGAASTAITDKLGKAAYTAISGTLPAAGFMIATLVWLAEHQPDLLDRAAHVILPKDYVRLRLTGEIATDISDAAATGAFDVSRRTWATDVLRALDLPTDIFPPALDSTAVTGRLTADAAAELDLPPGIPVVAGCADQPAQAVANGIIAPGVASVTTGSGGQVFIPLTLSAGGVVPVDDRVHVFNHAVPGMWYTLGAILSAGLALRWLRGITGLNGQPDAYATLSAEAAAVPPGASGLLFLPYLTGERTPHMDPAARGAFVGLSDYHQRGHLARAVMEGVTFALRQTLDICRGLGEPVERVIVAGGGAESDVWRQMQADIFGLPLQKSLMHEQTSTGAALLAGVGAGVYASVSEACADRVRYGDVTTPDPTRQARYNELYEAYLTLYPRLQANLHQLTAISLND